MDLDIIQKNKRRGIFIATFAVFAVGVATAFGEVGSQRTKLPSSPLPSSSSSATADVRASTSGNFASDDSGSEDSGSDGSGSDDSSSGITRGTTKTAPKTSLATAPTVTSNTSKQSASVYKDGTYSATGSYMSPGGYDQVGVTLTLSHDIITNVSVTPMPGDGTSARYQNRFISSYKQYVVGQNIANVNLTVVSGSSLTPIGFNDALAQIESQAKA